MVMGGGKLIRSVFCRFYSAAASTSDSFRASDLTIRRCARSQMQPKPQDWDKLKFGHVFSDHMLTVNWTESGGWEKPVIRPLENLILHPGAKVLHYGIELFEGMKSYRGVDGKIRLFRPEENMRRMYRSAARSALPTFDEKECLECINELIRLDSDWVPYSTSASLYVRPTMIGTDPRLGVSQPKEALLYVLLSPVGPYFITGFNPVSLYADPKFCRAWPGGVGNYKMGSNYGPTILIGKIAQEHGCQQVLWLYGKDEQLTEVGTMNIFMLWFNEAGEKELITPPLQTGLILPGITRLSLLEVCREWNEFKVSERPFTMDDIRKGLKEKRVLEMFGAGTASVVCPVERIHYIIDSEKTEDLYIPTMEQNSPIVQRLYDHITDIQYGKISRPEWTPVVVE